VEVAVGEEDGLVCIVFPEVAYMEVSTALGGEPRLASSALEEELLLLFCVVVLMLLVLLWTALMIAFGTK
jgi:hypothetical protein